MRPGVVRRAYLSESWPQSKPVRWKAREGLGAGVVSSDGGEQAVVFDLKDAEAPEAPTGAPLRFGYLAQVQTSDFVSWAEVSALAAPLYRKASTLAADSPLHAEIARIKAASSDPKARAIAALELVEDKVRYLYVGLNNTGYVPADADLTWARRFGDCKAKTALLLALLQGLGVDAQPALTNTEQGDGMDERLPGMQAFDHVAVRARIAGKSYWLDGTRIGDTDIDDLPTPDYHWMLPVQPAGAVLERLYPEPYATPQFETRVRVDASAGMDAPASAHAENIFRGDAGLALALKLQAMSRVELDRNLRAYWRQAAPWVEPKQVSFKTGEHHELTLLMDGQGAIDWSRNGAGRAFMIDDSTIGGETRYKREPGPAQDAPFAVSFPMYARHTVAVTLPDKGARFFLINDNAVDKAVAGVQYHRVARLDQGVATVEMTERALAPEFPAAEAPAATAILRDWGMHTVMIGRSDAAAKADDDWAKCSGPDAAAALAGCTNLIRAAKPGSQDMANALYDRGCIYARQEAWDKAIADFTSAIATKPDMMAAYFNRAIAYGHERADAAAIQDYDAAIRLKPDFRPAFLNRGMAHSADGEFDLAIADYARAIELDPQDSTARLQRGLAHAQKGEWDLAIQDDDEGIRLKPEDPTGWANRGYARARKKQWDQAIQDYDQAIRLKPDLAWALVQRGAVHGIKREADLAMADFDRAIELAPREADAWRDRGRIYAQKKDWDHAIGDDAAAIRLAPDFVEAYVERAQAYLRKGDAEAAFKDLDKAVQLKPNDAWILNARCWERARTGAGLDLAMSDCDRAVALQPTRAAILDSRGYVPFRRGEYQSAISDFDSALKVAPKMAPSLYVRGLAKLRLGQTADGEADIAAAKLIDPQVATTYGELAAAPQTAPGGVSPTAP